jgi:hypothetical protein
MVDTTTDNTNMNNNFIYRIRSRSKAPTGGEMLSWFVYYKWNREDPAFLPLHFPKQFLGIEKGDRVWILVDGCVFGCVIVSWVHDSNVTQEIWFDERWEQSSDYRQHQSKISRRLHDETRAILPELVTDWTATLRRAPWDT